MFKKIRKKSNTNEVQAYMSQLLNMLAYNTGGSLGVGNKKAINKIFGRSPWYRMCVAKRSRDIATIPFILYDTSNGEKTIIKDHPYLDLLKQFNPKMLGFQARELLQRWYDNNGEWIIWVEENIVGQPINLYPFNPDKIVKQGNQNEDWIIITEAGQKNIPDKNIIYLRDINPDDEYGRGAGQGQAASDELAIIEKINKMLGITFDNRAVPPYIIRFEGAAEENLKKAREDWFNNFKGFLKAGIPMFTNKKVDIQRMAYNFEETQIFELSKESKKDMRLMWGIPASLIGDEENSNKATNTNAWNIYTDNVLIPPMELICQLFNIKLTPRFGKNLELGYKNPSKSENEFILDVMKAAPYSFKINEYRRMARLEEWEGEKGQKIFVPLNFAEFQGNALIQPDEEITGEKTNDKIQTKKISLIKKKILKQDEEIEEEDLKDEIELAVLLAILLLIDRNSFFNSVKNGYLVSLEKNIKNNFELLGLDNFIPDMKNPRIDNFMNLIMDLSVNNILDTFNKRAREIFKTSKEEGLNKTQLEKKLNDELFEPYKKGDLLSPIGNTESQTLFNFATLEAARQSNNPLIKKEWLTQKDDKVRTSHLIDGQVKGLNEKFILNDGVQVDYPGDITAPPEDRINERCFLVYNIQGRSFAGNLDQEQIRETYWNNLLSNKEETQRNISAAYSRAFQELQLEINRRIRNA